MVFGIIGIEHYGALCLCNEGGYPEKWISPHRFFGEEKMLEWIKGKMAVQIRRDYQVGLISKKEATEKLVSIIANKMPTLVKMEKCFTDSRQEKK